MLDECVALTGLLIESLDPETEQGIEQAWVAEIERRMTELDSGTVKPVPWGETQDSTIRQPACSGAPLTSIRQQPRR
jgi:putative addiction module component (TIGR02574 family)